MSSAELNTILGIIGFCLMTGLTINAFFLKEIIKGLNDLRVKLAELNIEMRGYDHRIEHLETRVDRIDQAQTKCMRGKA